MNVPGSERSDIWQKDDMGSICVCSVFSLIGWDVRIGLFLADGSCTAGEFATVTIRILVGALMWKEADCGIDSCGRGIAA